MVLRKLLGIGGLLLAAGAAHADSAETVNLFHVDFDPALPVAAVTTNFPAESGKPVRLIVYDSEEAFLENARIKLEAPLNDEGFAVLPLADLEPGVYAFAAYLDENGDGVLNRGKVLGRPKEPIAFSNGAKAKLRKPRFEEAKVEVVPGGVIVIALED